MFPKITPVVLNLIIINVIVYFAAVSLSFMPDLAMYYPTMPQFKPYQIVTHFFMHSKVDPQHLLFNMLGLFFLGPMVEKTIGGKNFLILYIVSAIGALVAHLGVDFYQQMTYGINRFPGLVGASGAIYGVVIAFVTLFPNTKMMIIPIPVPIKAKYLGLGYIAYDLYNGVMGSQTGTAHFAHLGGALTGFLLIKFFFKVYKNRS
jgi:rhomboid-like protein